MRIAPVGLYFHRSDRFYEEASASAEVTHAHPVGKDGAAVLAWAIAQAVILDPSEDFSLERFMNGLIAFSRTPEIKEKMERVGQLIKEEAPPERAANQLGQSVEVAESMPFAVYSFLKYPKSYEDCLFCAILQEGDRDTLGAMACAISGAYLGVDAISPSWRRKLENRSVIEELALALFQNGCNKWLLS
jgi:poly(ADP-ribose) glycohydrolase ARH3